MKFKVEAECTPLEARAFLGLPDITPLNDYVVDEMRKRMDSNISMLQPEELMKGWMALGGQAQDHFMKLMTSGVNASLKAASARK